MNHCIACGKEVSSTSRFCPYCGGPVAATPPTPSPARPPIDQKVLGFLAKAGIGTGWTGLVETFVWIKFVVITAAGAVIGLFADAILYDSDEGVCIALGIIAGLIEATFSTAMTFIRLNLAKNVSYLAGIQAAAFKRSELTR